MLLILNTSFVPALCLIKAQSDPSRLPQHKVDITHSHPKKLVVYKGCFCTAVARLPRIKYYLCPGKIFFFFFFINISLIH